MGYTQVKKRRKYGDLIRQFTVTDFKLRYSNSVLGYLWSLLNPLLLFGVLYMVFSIFMRFRQVEYYQVYLLSGIMLWRFFSEATDSGMMSLQLKATILNKVSFPRIIIPVSSSLTNIITFLLNLVILCLFIYISKVPVTPTALFGLLTVFELFVLCFGVTLFLSAFYLKFRDLSHIWGVILQMGFWATPIIYPIDIVPPKFHIIFKLNPMARLINNFRMTVIQGELPIPRNILLNLIMVFTVFGLGLYLFQRNQRHFAEWL